jgi:hypothetical protein
MADHAVMAAHLERLRDALDRTENVTVRLNAAVAVPFLDVASHAFPGVRERIKCRLEGDSGWLFVWGWGPVIGDVDDIKGVVIAVRTALRPLCGAPGDGRR